MQVVNEFLVGSCLLPTSFYCQATAVYTLSVAPMLQSGAYYLSSSSATDFSNINTNAFFQNPKRHNSLIHIIDGRPTWRSCLWTNENDSNRGQKPFPKSCAYFLKINFHNPVPATVPLFRQKEYKEFTRVQAVAIYTDVTIGDLSLFASLLERGGTIHLSRASVFAVYPAPKTTVLFKY
ncbi:hypothetical protein LENED_005757 [Lentinula edodes]|uniref:Uncharacterized protein n=1 Tax=Lentinula edodes TaxID=5353 RepID=A0A1Q3E9U4_LENED|nr:hypothetical protein LENED_005757 [Lentinula edodes]